MIELPESRWLLALVALPLLWILTRGLPRRGLLTVLRMAAWTCLVLALGRLALVLPARVSKDVTTVIAYDMSASVDEAARAAANRLSSALSESVAPAVWLAFAATPTVADLSTQEFYPTDAKWRLETDIAAAIQQARGVAGDRGRVILLSDGNPTQGDALAASAGRGAVIYTVPIDPVPRFGVQLQSLEVPSRLREGQPFKVTIDLVSEGVGSSQIEIYQDRQRVEVQTVTLEPGANRFEFQHTIDDTRLTLLEVRLAEASDDQEGVHRLATLVQCDRRPSLLVVSGEPDAMEPFRQALQLQGIGVTILRPATAPRRPDEFSRFDAVLLVDVAATDLSRNQLAAIRDHVRQGAGLIMLGSDRTFGLGGYDASPLGALLPLHGDFERTAEMPSLAMVLAIDRSSSMTGADLQLAKAAAIATAETLKPQSPDRTHSDQLGIVAFDAAASWVRPLQPIEDMDQVVRQIESLTAGGGTKIDSALVAAHDALAKTDARLKHLILVTDGHSISAEWKGQLEAMTADRVTVSTVAVGGSADQALLAQLAEMGQGRHYFAADPLSLPQLLVRETLLATGSALVEQPFQAKVLHPTSMLQGIPLVSAPPLDGYIRTRPKATAELIMITDAGDPLLAHGRGGLGYVVAFTSDASARWAAAWLDWPGYARFWAQVTRHAMRGARTDGPQLSLRRRGAKVIAELEVLDRDQVLDPSGLPTAEVTRSDGTRRRMSMSRVAPGTYRVEIPTPIDQAVFVAAMTDQQTATSAGISSSYPEELRIKPLNRSLLLQIAERSQGQFDAAIEPLLRSPQATVQRHYELAPFLLLLALGLFLADVRWRK